MWSSNELVPAVIVQAFFHCTLAIILASIAAVLTTGAKQTPTGLKEQCCSGCVIFNYPSDLLFLSPPKQITIKGENKASENHLSVINASTHSPCQQVSTTGCRKRNILSANPQSTNVYWFQMRFAVYLIPVENISTEAALRQTEVARRSITHKVCLPCHTLERNFRNSARFLDSWGGNETINSASSRAKSTGVTLQTCDVRHYTFIQITNTSTERVRRGYCQAAGPSWGSVWDWHNTQAESIVHSVVLPPSTHQSALTSEPRPAECCCGQRRPRRPGCCRETRKSLRTHGALKTFTVRTGKEKQEQNRSSVMPRQHVCLPWNYYGNYTLSGLGTASLTFI